MVVLVMVAGLAVVLGGIAVVGMNLASDDPERVALPDPRRPGPDEDDDGRRQDDESESLWSYESRDGAIKGLVTDGERVCSTSHRDLFCVDAESGSEVFRVELPEVPTAPVLVNGTLVVGSGAASPHEEQPSGINNVHGYAVDGRHLWSVDVPDQSLGYRSDAPSRPPQVVGGVVAFYDQHDVRDEFGLPLPVVEWAALDVATGAERWRVEAQTGRQQELDQADDVVISDGRRFYAVVSTPARGPVTAQDLRDLDPADPGDAVVLAIIEENAMQDPTDPDPGLSDFEIDLIGDYFLQTINDELVDRGTPAVAAIDPSSGREQWRFAMEGVGEYEGAAVTGAVSLPDQRAVALTIEDDERKVVVLDEASGALRWEAEIETGDPLSDFGPVGSIAQADGVTLLLDGDEVRAYDDAGGDLWTEEFDSEGSAELAGPPHRLVVLEGHVYITGNRLFEIDPETGDRALVARDPVTDVKRVGDALVVAGTDCIEAVPLSSGEAEELRGYATQARTGLLRSVPPVGCTRDDPRPGAVGG